jgi:hypothetical protein
MEYVYVFLFPPDEFTTQNHDPLISYDTKSVTILQPMNQL